jgi:hypothetical protein
LKRKEFGKKIILEKKTFDSRHTYFIKDKLKEFNVTQKFQEELEMQALSNSKSLVINS